MPKLNYKAIVLGLALCCLVAPVKFSIAGVPIILQSFALFATAGVLGKWNGSIVALLYLLTGAVGVPVFAGYQAGFEKLIGPTAGFLWAFPFVCFYLGWTCHTGQKSFFHYIVYFFRAHLLWMIPGFTVLYFTYEGLDLFGTVIRMLPDVLIKSGAGGLLAYWITERVKA